MNRDHMMRRAMQLLFGLSPENYREFMKLADELNLTVADVHKWQKEEERLTKLNS